MAAKPRRPSRMGFESQGKWSQDYTPMIASPAETLLQEVLTNPIAFVPATILTFEDEANMAPVLRPRKHLNETEAQQRNRMNVRRPHIQNASR